MSSFPKQQSEQRDFERLLRSALAVIESVSDYSDVSERILFHKIFYSPQFTDRAEVTLWGGIRVGPAACGSALGLAGTLVHEEYHLKQPLLWRTWSFWRGILRREHTMKWLEWPAYRQQISFLMAAARQGIPGAAVEAQDVLDSFRSHYGEPEDSVFLAQCGLSLSRLPP